MFSRKNIEILINRKFFLAAKIGGIEKIINERPTIIFPKQPFITVSREPGSGGKLIAERLAEFLNYQFYGKEILERLHKEFETNHEKFVKEYGNLYDEKVVNAIEGFIENVVYPNLITQDNFVRRLTKCLNKITTNGKCVILGRGANFFTDHKLGFHVRITAPFNFRVEKTIRYEHLSRYEAEERVKQVSRDRKHFVEKYFGPHIDNSEFYDLVLNRVYYSIEEAVEIIIYAFKKKIK